VKHHHLITFADSTGEASAIRRQINNVFPKRAREDREDLRTKFEKMDEEEEEVHSPLILVMSEFDGEELPMKPVEQSTDETERKNIQGIIEVIIWCNKWGDND
jgi:hypothetical protein